MLCLPFTDGAFKGHFGKVHLERPPLSTVVKLLCLQLHVTEVECVNMPRCEVSISVRCNDDSCMQVSTHLHNSLTYLTTFSPPFLIYDIISCGEQPVSFLYRALPQLVTSETCVNTIVPHTAIDLCAYLRNAEMALFWSRSLRMWDMSSFVYIREIIT